MDPEFHSHEKSAKKKMVVGDTDQLKDPKYTF